jgi:signal transduction histidine kinase
MLAKITFPEPQRISQFQGQEKMDQLELITSGIAHDFNNLLTSILGQSSLALNQLPQDNVARRHIEKAMKAAEYATVLTRQLLTYAKNGRCDTEAVNLNQLVTDNAGLLETIFASGVSLHLDLDRQLPHILTRPGQIQQVVMNLIINAAEAIPQPSGSVTVRTGTRLLLPGNGNYEPLGGRPALREFVYLQVSDTGAGIDPGTLDRMFEPFFTTKPQGKGLGLSAVRDIVSSYKGEITVESKLGEGTTITVYFPCRQDDRPLHRPVH